MGNTALERFDVEGIWWLPDNPENAISGTLHYAPNTSIKLELNGCFGGLDYFTDMVQKIQEEGEFKTIILGMSKVGKVYTLLKCHLINLHFSAPGYPSVSYLVQYIIQGHHFESEDRIIFSKISLKYSNLDEWVNKSGFKVNLTLDEIKGSLKKYEMSYEYPEPREVDIHDIARIAITYNFNNENHRMRDFSLKQDVFIDIEPVSATHLSKYIEYYVYNIRNFLCLGMGVPVFLLEMGAKAEEAKDEISGKTRYKEISILYRQGNVDEALLDVHNESMPFSLRDINENVGEYLNRWFNLCDQLRPVYSLYIGTIHSPQLFLENEFLNLINSMEAYHRRRRDVKYVSDDEYTPIYGELVKAIPEGLDASFRASIKARLKYLNEISLRKRLKELVDLCDCTFNLFSYGKDDFIEAVINTRNYLVHYDERLKGLSREGIELKKMNLALDALVFSCLLIEIEAPNSLIVESVKRNRKYASILGN